MARPAKVPTTEQLAAAFDAGCSVRQVAALAGCTPRAVRYAARRGDLLVPQTRRRAKIRARLDDREWLAAELREHQRSFSSIANQLGCSTDEVRSAATVFGLEAPAQRVRFPLLADSDWLRQQLGARRPLASIAAEVGCSESAVRAAATRHGIAERRRPSDQRQFPPLHDAAWLHQQYVQAGRSSTQIAAQLGCSPNAVLRALHDHGVPVRSIRRRFPQLHDRAWLRRCYVHEGRRPSAIAKDLGCHRGTVVKALHRSRITLRAQVRFRQLRDRAWLRRRYVIEGKTLRAIATEVGCQPSTVVQALRRARIKPRRRRRPSSSRLRTDWQRYGTINSVAALYEVSPARAELWLAELGIFSPHVRHLPRNELRALVRRAAPTTAIADRFGVSQARVRVEMLRHGVDRAGGRP